MATRFQGSAIQTSALNAYISLMRAAGTVTGRVHGHLDEAGLTISQFAVLEALLHLGPSCQKELAVKLLQSPGNLTMVIDHLERSSLARRCRGKLDRRVQVVHLTAKGQKLIAHIFPRHVAELVREFAILMPHEQRQLRHLCRKLGLRQHGQAEDNVPMAPSI